LHSGEHMVTVTILTTLMGVKGENNANLFNFV
jgi:hypothetical protein